MVRSFAVDGFDFEGSITEVRFSHDDERYNLTVYVGGEMVAVVDFDEALGDIFHSVTGGYSSAQWPMPQNDGAEKEK